MRHTSLWFCALIAWVVDPVLEPVCAKDEARQRQLTTKPTMGIRMACSCSEIFYRQTLCSAVRTVKSARPGVSLPRTWCEFFGLLTVSKTPISVERATPPSQPTVGGGRRGLV